MRSREDKREENDFPCTHTQKCIATNPLRLLKCKRTTRTGRTLAQDRPRLDESGRVVALCLDTFTNNSSLVLAIELVESGNILLFAADAQAGNWAAGPK